MWERAFILVSRWRSMMFPGIRIKGIWSWNHTSCFKQQEKTSFGPLDANVMTKASATLVVFLTKCLHIDFIRLFITGDLLSPWKISCFWKCHRFFLFFCFSFVVVVFFNINNKEPEITVQQCKAQYKNSARNSILIPPYTQIAKLKSKQVETQEIM